MVEAVPIKVRQRPERPAYDTGDRAAVLPIRNDWRMKRRMSTLRISATYQRFAACSRIPRQKLYHVLKEAYGALYVALFFRVVSTMMQDMPKWLPPAAEPSRPDWSSNDGIGLIYSRDAEF
jgi:hypothetical protein